MGKLIMFGIVLLLLITLFFKARKEDTINTFFDLNNTKAMRGFWCIVIILVHVPMAYTNSIQNMIGSFAYIGVTFFFMTSAFGLIVSTDKKPEKMKTFWRSRLPKLLITSWIVNIICSILFLILGIEISSAWDIISINAWVVWLIICYFFFWITYIIWKKSAAQKVTSCALVIIFSLFVYYLHTNGIYTTTVWVTECFGFVWGIVLAAFLKVLYDFFEDKWFVKMVTFCIISLFLGVVYLKFKYIPFYGDYLLKIILGLAITLFILSSNAKISYGNRINNFLGDISFEIYLIHGQVFKMVDKVFYNQISSEVFIAISIIVTIILAYVAHLLISVIMKQVNKVIVK